MGARCLRCLLLTSVIVVLTVWYQLDSQISVYRESARSILDFTVPSLDTIVQDEAVSTTTAASQITASAENRTWEDARVLVYNRVPKCGSTTLRNILRKLAKQNNFVHHSSGLYGQRKLTRNQEKIFVINQERETQEHPDIPTSVDRHFYFINFTKYEAPRPIYINMLRDPVSAFVSTFYYVRSPIRWERLLRTKFHPADLELLLKYQREIYPRQDTDQNSRQLVLPNETWLNKTLRDCVLSADFDCNFEPGTERETFVAFICGSEPDCSVVKSASALQRAKLNLEREYSVVGLVEHMNVSLQVMEAYVPLFLRGLQQMYHSQGGSLYDNRTPHEEATPEVREALSVTFSHDVELYEFARQRLFLQLSALQLQSSSTIEPFV